MRKLVISIEEVFHELKESYSVIDFEGIEGSPLNDFVIKGEQYKAKYSTFFKVEFNGLVEFENTDLSVGTSFDTCKFKEPCVFTNVKTSGEDLILNSDSDSLVFKNCTFNERVLFKGKANSLFGNLTFKDCTFEKGLEVEALKVLEGGVSLINCTIKKTLNIFNVDAKTEIQCSGDKVSCYSRFHNITCPAITFMDENIFEDCIEVQSSKLSVGIAFNDGLFKKEVIFSLIETTTSGLVISGSTFEKAVIINYHLNKLKPTKGISHFHLVDSKFINGIYVNGIQDLFVAYPYVDEINVNFSPELKGNIEFRNLNVGILNLSGTNTSVNLYLQDLFINQIKIKGLINNAGLIFSRIKASYSEWFNDKDRKLVRENALYIDDSNFGRTQFFQVDFSSFGKIVFHNNILTEISTSLVKWFKPEQLYGFNEESYRIMLRKATKEKNVQQINSALSTLSTNYSSKKEIYRQLKIASQSQGNIPESLEFQRWEMDNYRKLVNIRKPRNWNEYFILNLSLSNNFGQDFLKALGLFILFSFACYIPVGLFNSSALDYSHYARSCYDIALNFRVVICDNLKDWFVIMNPAHSMKDIYDEPPKISALAYFWDIICRIVVSYFIFQIISGFRKFLNK